MLLGATKKNMFLWLLLSLIFLAPIFFSNSGFAASSRQTCRSESQAPEAASVYTACNLCFDGAGNKIGSGREGAVWINAEDSNSSSSQSAFISGDEAIRNNDGTTFTAYLHGSFFNCNGSSVSALDAKYVHIIQANQSSWNGDPSDIDKNEYMVGSEPSRDLDFVTLQSRVLYRGSGSTPSLQWSNIAGLSPLKLTINVSEMKKYAKQSGHACIINETDDNESADGLEKEISQISCVVGIWRCPSSSSGVTENCWANHAELVVKEFEKLVPMNVKGKVTVVDDNNRSNKATTEWRTKNSVLPSCSTEYCIPFEDINNMPIEIQIKPDEEASVTFTYNLKRKSGRASDRVEAVVRLKSTTSSTSGQFIDITSEEPWTDTETVTWSGSDGNKKICRRLNFVNPRYKMPVGLAACANITVKKEEAKYQAETRVKFGNNDEQSTGLQQDYTKKVGYSIKKGTTAQIIFKHYGYSSTMKTKSIKWALTFTAPSKYNTINRNDSPDISSPMTIPQENGLFTTDTNPTFTSDYGYITFDEVGTFKFCETIIKDEAGVRGVGICLTVTVTNEEPPTPEPEPDDPPTPPVSSCAEHAPSSYGSSTISSGTTSTWSMVATKTGTYRHAESSGSIWAKPGDTIYFEHCYFPGAQTVRTNDRSIPHIEEPTPTDHLSMPTYTTTVNGTVSDQTFDHQVGNLTAIVAQRNEFEIDTGRYDLLNGGNSIIFNVTGTGFSAPSTPSGHSVYVPGTLGSNADAKTVTNDLSILTKAAGQTISQTIRGSDANASITRGDKSHNGTWTYYYPIQITTSTISSASAENPQGCPSSPSHASIEFEPGVTMSSQINCDKNNPHIDQPAKECGEDEENCTPQKELSHYEWTETYYEKRAAQATWTINHYNDETGYFANYWTNASRGGIASSSVYVKVPYNYNNSIVVEFAGGNIYSGETFGVKEARVTVSPRSNSTTDGDYATIVPSSVAKLYVFHADRDLTGINVGRTSGNGDCSPYSNIEGKDCMIANTDSSKQLNTGLSMTGSSNDTFFTGQSYNVYDLKAGEYMCIGASIWPATSNGDTDMGTSGNNTTAYSAPVCQPVYKRPTFQIWNGGIYAAGRIQANSFTKNALNGYAAYRTSGWEQQYTFSSWVEQGIVANKGVVGLASGAATGFTSYNDRRKALENNPGGIAGTDFCNVSTLTIPNTSCGNLSGINFVSAGLKRAKNTIYDTIYNAVISGRAYKAVSGTIDLANANNYNEASPGMRYTESSDNNTLAIFSSSLLSSNTTHVIHAKGDLTIGGGIEYDYRVSYTTSSQVPQYMIFADGNININCDVGKIDAWLVARGTINTCGNGGDENDPARSNPLQVYGVVIADKLELTRTYGASTGKDSAIPAETFVLSVTNRFFGKTSSNEDPTLYPVYLRELSPRY